MFPLCDISPFGEFTGSKTSAGDYMLFEFCDFGAGFAAVTGISQIAGPEH